MIESDKNEGTFTMSCDEAGCVESETYEAHGNWQNFIGQAKAGGWRIWKEEGCLWYHCCPGCMKERNRKRSEQHQEKPRESKPEPVTSSNEMTEENIPF